MIKWLLTGLEDACSGDVVWDYLELEMPCSPKLAAPTWDDTAPAAPSTAAPAATHDDLLWRNCMWGGRCGSHDHGAFSRCDTAPLVAPRPGDSLLKKPGLIRAPHPSPPPSPGPYDDLDKEMVFVSMTDVVSDVRWTAPALPPPAPAPSVTSMYVHEDHSYHLTRHSSPINTDALGVQTPSDSGTDDDFFEDEILEELPDLDADDVDFFGPESVFKDIAESVAEELLPIKKSVSESESYRMSDTDEEIDVVSVEKARALPTNPTVHDRHQLQQTVANAVGRRGRRHRHHRRHHRRHHHHHHRRRIGRPKQFRPAETAPVVDDLNVYHKRGRGRPKSCRPNNNRLTTVASDMYDSEGGKQGRGASKRCRSPETTSTADESEGFGYKSGRGRRKKLRRVKLTMDDYDSEDKPKRRRMGESQMDGKGKRSLHNNMERQRRIDLSNLVHAVRQLVPSISDKGRSPRIEVLREAADYCRQLQVQATQLASYKRELQLHNERLQRIHQAALQNLPAKSLRKLHHHASCHQPKKNSRRPKNSDF